ncbi:MAG: carboxypeptidase regulatory-like domain-containing protein [Ilumatobacteraceae bacterium]
MNQPTTSGDPRSNVGDRRMRVDLTPSVVHLQPGDIAEVTVEVTNTSDTIRMFQVDVLGVDPSYVTISVPILQLFPDERGSTSVLVMLPASYPAGRHRLGVQVSEPGVTAMADLVAEFDVLAPSVPEVAVSADPSSSTGGSATTFIATVVNTGNTAIEAGVSVSDAEQLVTAEYSPPSVSLQPGARGAIQIDVTGPRPWFGMPVVRTVEVTAHTPPVLPKLPDVPDAHAITAVAFVQRPRFSRRAVAIAGLLLAVTMFALVINASFASVADLSRQNEELLKQSLGADQPLATRPLPGSIGGRITSTTGGGIDGATVEVYEEATSAVVPVASTVTDADGFYTFGSLGVGIYRVRVTAAGFGEVWYPTSASITDAFAIDLGAGSESDEVDVALTGQPGAVAGTVFGEDVSGSIVTVQIPGDAIAGSDIPAPPTIVATVELDATGAFSLENLPTPSAYELVVSKAGYATETRTLNVGPGEGQRGLEVLLRRGDGRITGTVVDANGVPIPGVDVVASDGLASVSTRTLSGDGAGTFEIRDLTTPATFALSAEPSGYESQSITVNLGLGQRIDDLRLVLNASTGSITGLVTDAVGKPLGGVVVRAVGSEGEVFTRTLSIGSVGTWYLSGLPVPAAYTVTFEGDGLQTQAVSVDLPAGAGADLRGLDVTLTPSTASVLGDVIETGGDPIGGVAITLASSSLTKQTLTADEPAGEFHFASLPPGSYTLSFSRVGSSPQTILVDLTAGQTLSLATVELEAQARFVGVVERAGVPAADVGVQAYKLSEYPSTASATVISQADGSFEIVGIDAPETYVIEFRVPAGGQVAGSQTVFLPAGRTIDIGTVPL